MIVEIVGCVAMTDWGVTFWIMNEAKWAGHPWVLDWIANWEHHQNRLIWMYLSLCWKGSLANVH